MQVVFRDRVDSLHPIAAKGVLNIPQSDKIGQHVGRLLSFSITADYSDLPLRTHSEGVIAKAGSKDFYEFEIIEMDEAAGSGPRNGHLRLLSEAQR